MLQIIMFIVIPVLIFIAGMLAGVAICIANGDY